MSRLSRGPAIPFIAALATAAAAVSLAPSAMAAAPAAQDSAPVAVRVGDHPGFGRIVFDLRRHTSYHLTRDGDQVTLHFAGAPTIAAAPGVPRNVRAIQETDGATIITLAPGATTHALRFGNLVAIDVLDPAAPPATANSQAGPAAAPTRDAASHAVSSQERKRNEPPRARPLVQPPPSAIAQAGAQPAPSTPPPVATAPLVPVIASDADAPARPAAAATAAAAAAGSTGAVAADASPDRPVAGRPAIPASSGAASAAPAPGAASTRASLGGPDALALVVTRAPAADGADDAGTATIAVPFDADVGVAAFRRDNQAMVVFDSRRPLDLSMLHGDPVLGSASVQLLAAGTLLRLDLPPEGSLALAHGASGWAITVRTAPLPDDRAGMPGVAPPIAPAPRDGALALALAAPGMVVTMADPASGATLLIGTQRPPGHGSANRTTPAGSIAQGVAVKRRAPGYVLLQSWIGVAIEPLADDLSLNPASDGFVLAAGNPAEAGPLGMPPATAQQVAEADALADAAALTRRYDFPPLSLASLLLRLREQTDAAAAAPPLARGQPRIAVAQTMIALGLGPEAQGVLQRAAADDPNLAADPGVAGLAAIAALVSGRSDQAAALIDPSLSGTDEIAFWRAVRDAQLRNDSPQAAATFASTVRLALSYPAPLAARVLPLALETMVAGGQDAAAGPILAARKDDPTLALARAEDAEARGDDRTALAGYDALFAGDDRLSRARAGLRATELRLAKGMITPVQAAAGLDAMIYAWRGDWRERALRERLAAIQQQAGEWASAFATLRETDALFPDDHVRLHAALTDAFAAMVRGGADRKMPPIDFVSLIDQNTDLVPDGPAGMAIARLLADRLEALDLPDRAGPLLERLMRATRDPATKAGLGASLAALHLHENDAPAALAALAASAPAPADPNPADPMPAAAQPATDPAAPATGTAPTGTAPSGTAPSGTAPSGTAPSGIATATVLPPDLTERRTLLFAQASAGNGDRTGALRALARLGTDAALLESAALQEQAHDWAPAARALADYAQRTLPPQGPLNDTQQRLVMRWASAASQAGDAAALAELRQREGVRMQAGELDGMFRLLTAEPVREIADLDRAGRETKLARALPDQLKALAGPSAGH